MKDVATPATQSEGRGTIKEALTKAALVNYERLSEEARIEGRLKYLLWDMTYTFQLSLHCLIIYFIFVCAADRQNNQGEVLVLKGMILYTYTW